MLLVKDDAGQEDGAMQEKFEDENCVAKAVIDDVTVEI